MNATSLTRALRRRSRGRRRRRDSMSGRRMRKRAPLGVLLSARMEPPCFLHDFGGDGEAEAGAAMLGGVERQEEALANFVGEAVAGVGDFDLDGGAVFAERGLRTQSTRSRLPCMASAALSMRLARARRMASWSARTGGRPGSRSRLHGDAFEPAGKQRERFFGDLIHVAGARLRRRKLRERGELVDQRAQGSDAGENDFAALANDGGRVGLAAIKMPADALGGERDGRERIFDFVRDALRHFFPRELALRAKQLRGVFDHENGAGSARGKFESRAGDGEVHVAAARDGIRAQWRRRPCAGRGG